MPDFKDHIWALIVTLLILLTTYVVLVLVHSVSVPKLMDGVLVVLGGIVTLATSAVTKAAIMAQLKREEDNAESTRTRNTA